MTILKTIFKPGMWDLSSYYLHTEDQSGGTPLYITFMLMEENEL